MGADTSLYGYAALEAVVIAVTSPGGAILWQGPGLARGRALAMAGWTGAPRVPGAVRLMGSPIELDEARIKGSRRQLVSARNRSGQPVRITGLALYDCVNVQERCVARDTSLLLAPREERLLVEVRPWMTARSPKYQVAYKWQLE